MSSGRPGIRAPPPVAFRVRVSMAKEEQDEAEAEAEAEAGDSDAIPRRTRAKDRGNDFEGKDVNLISF